MIQLINGESLEEMDKLIDQGIVVDAVITDPPYGTTNCKWDTVIPFEPMWERLKKLTKKNGAIVLFRSQPFTSALVMSNPKMFKYEWYWRKTRPGGGLNAKKMPLADIEIISVFYEKQPTYNPQGVQETFKENKITPGRTKSRGTRGNTKLGVHIQTQTNYPRRVLDFNSPHNVGEQTHPTQKPVALMEYLIKTYTNEGETVLDFTMGNGTTMLACKNLNRNGIGIELDPTYFEIAKKRIGD